MSYDKLQLKHKIVLLTGGGGRYGRGLVSALVSAGATLIIASRKREELMQIALEEGNKGHTVAAEYLDLGEESSIVTLCRSILESYGRIDGLINNSVARPMKDLDDDISAWQTSLAINADGTFLLTRAIGRIMKLQRQGSIVNIASIQGMVGPNDFLYEDTDMTPAPDYFFHKGGMISLTRYFASALGPYQVRVNSISPGGIFDDQDPQFVERYSKMTFLRRMADITDLVGPVVFLLSDAAKYVTGVNIPVDGGYTAK